MRMHKGETVPAAQDAPEVSVVIPTRNRRALLERTLSSALAQQAVRVEVIVVDDHSEDETRRYLGSIRDSRVRPILKSSNQGVAAARNAGIDAARGRWVAFLDDDDLWAPRKLHTQLVALDGAAAGWGWTSALVAEEGRRSTRVWHGPSPDNIAVALRGGNEIPAGASSAIAATDLLRELGGFDPTLAHLADWDMWIRLADRAPAGAVDEPLVKMVIHAQGMHALATAEAIDEFALLREKHPDVQAGSYARWIARAHYYNGRKRVALRDYLRIRWRYRMRSPSA
jgi:glycosyltransferase involved in cell wall biosynthesis